MAHLHSKYFTHFRQLLQGELILSSRRIFLWLVIALFQLLTCVQEPRSLVTEDQETQEFFGKNVNSLAQNEPVIFGLSDIGYPRISLTDVPVPAVYYLQAVIQPYDYFQKGDGHNVWLPRTVVNRVGGLMEGPGTLYSDPIVVHLTSTSQVTINVSNIQPDVPFVGPANDTQYIKHVSMYNERLSAFWGRNITLEACVLLPWGWSEHTSAQYPVVIYQVILLLAFLLLAHSKGHYSDDWASPVSFSENPPSSSLTGLAYVQAEYAYYLYRNWTDPNGLFKGRRVIVVTLKHPNPFFDDR